MSRVDDLIRDLCPEGVESRPLGEAGQFIRGRRITKDDFVEAGVGCIHYGELYTRYGTTAMETYSFVRPELAARLRLAQTGDLVIAATGENAEEVCKAVAWLGPDEIAIHDDCYVYRHTFDPTYVSYVFQSSVFHAQKIRFASGAKMVRVSGENLAKIRAPVPPLEIQREIVSILSKMESLEAELEAELEARRRQYAYYRDSLLTFAPRERERVRWAALSEVATFKYGYTARAATSGDLRFIRITDITENGTLSDVDAKYIGASAEIDDYRVAPGDLLMARTGATFGKTLLIRERMPAVYASFLIRISLDEASVLPGYYWHFAQSTAYWKQASRLVSRAGQPQFNANALRKVQFPVPPLDEQERIVATLDSFDTLVNDLSIGLPAEIRARRQQYEHYRDRLLTFEAEAA